MHVEVFAVNRRLVDLEVAGVDDDAGGCMDGQRHAVGNAVRDADELDRERTDRYTLARADGDERVRANQIVFLQLRLDQCQRQRRRIDRPGDERCHVRHATDVIFVTVREDERGRAALLLQIGEVWNNAIDPEELGVGEHHTGIDDDRRLAPGEGEHVHAELTEPAERNHFEHAGYNTSQPSIVTLRAKQSGAKGTA